MYDSTMEPHDNHPSKAKGDGKATGDERLYHDDSLGTGLSVRSGQEELLLVQKRSMVQ